MDDLPKLGNTFFKERAGVTAVATILNAIRCVWRETPNADVGIDGQIEHVDPEGRCTGRLVAVQIKSGPSFFEKATPEHIRFWPESKHRKYWHDFPVPVLVILFSPDSSTAHWADARRQLRSPEMKASAPIRVPWSQTLDNDHREALFQTAGPIDGRILSIEELAPAMAIRHLGDPQFDVSFLDLFVIGTTDIGRKVFYSMGMACDIAEVRAEVNKTPGIQVGPVAQDFCGDYVRFLVSQNLIHYDFTDFLIDWEDRQLQPTILCPLTPRGRLLLRSLLAIAGANNAAFAESPIGIMEESLAGLPRNLVQLSLLHKQILSNRGRA